MDFGRAFSYVFDDPDWFKKIGIVALVSLIPLIGQIVALGWALRVTRNVINADPSPLPSLDFGADIGLGFQALIIGLVYSLPIIILTLPMAAVDAAVSSQSSSDAANMMLLIVSLCFGLFSVVFGILLAFMLPAAFGNFVAKGELSAGLRFGEVWGLVRSNPGAYLVVVVGTIVAGLIAPLGTIACIIGVVLTYTYALAIQGHLYGQAYRLAKSPVAPPAAPRSTGDVPGAY